MNKHPIFSVNYDPAWNKDWINNDRWHAAFGVYTGLKLGIENVEKGREALVAGGKLTAEGVRGEMPNVVKREGIKRVGNARVVLEDLQRRSALTRETLHLPRPSVLGQPDLAALAKISLRREARDLMRGMDPHALTATLADPKANVQLVEAYFEFPALVPGLPDESRATIEKAAIERKYPEQLATLKVDDEVIAILSGSIDYTHEVLRKEAGFGENKAAYTEWFDTQLYPRH